MKKLALILISFVFLCCDNRESKVNQDELTGYDFRLFQNTPLWNLAKAVEDENSVNIKKIITDNKVNLNYKEPRFGSTLLMLAIKNDKFESAKMLLEAGADPNVPDSYRGTTAMIDAAGHDDPKYVQLLLNFKGNPNAVENAPVSKNDSSRDTPLSKAISALDANTLEKVKLLVEAGADMNYSNEGNPAYTKLPLADALMQDKPDVALYLLRKGADYKKVMYVMVDGHKVYILEALRKCMFEVNSKQYEDKKQIINFLKDKGLDYYKEPIPDYIVKDIKEKYPKDWEHFISVY